MRAVFLDRDGVLNRADVRDGKPYPPATVEALEINPETHITAGPEKSRFHSNSNHQSTGRRTRNPVESDCEKMHEKLSAALPIDAFYACYHDGPDGCECRKPKPGMLLRAAEEHAIPLNESFLVGDRWRDIDAGHAAGVRTIFIDYGYRERSPEHEPDARVASLKEAVNWILDVATQQSRR